MVENTTITDEEVQTPALEATETSIEQVAGLMYGEEGEGNAQDVPHDTFTQMVWDSVKFEDSSIVTMDSDNDQVVIQSDGKYTLSAYFHWEDDDNWSDGDRANAEWSGDTVDVQRNRKAAHSGWQSTRNFHRISVTDDFNEGDSVFIELQQRSGGSVSVQNGPDWGSFKVVRHG